MSQKRHTKAANWKRGIDCTWNISKNILIYMSAKVRVLFYKPFRQVPKYLQHQLQTKIPVTDKYFSLGIIRPLIT